MQGEDIVTAVRQLERGGDALLAPALTRRLLDRYASGPPQPSLVGLNRLTSREVEALRLLGRGRSNAEIAVALVVSEATVKTHVARVLANLGLRDRVQAVV